MPTLKKEELVLIDRYFRAVNYLSVGQLYLYDNPLLKRELTINDIKPNLVGHWGTAPGQNFIYTHLNRIIKKHNLNILYISGPGHGGQAMIANNYLDGTYTKFYPKITQDEKGMKKLFKQFSYPGGVSSHVAAETPGSIHEGGELGYSLAHAAGTVLDNKDLITACVIGDGEAETGPLATSWHLNKFLNPKTDGIVLPILHRNGYKISNPTVFGRMSKQEMEDFFYGVGWKPYFVAGDDPLKMHELMATTLEKVLRDIKNIKTSNKRIKYPMIVLTTPKGWTGPHMVDSKKIEGTFRAHQVPVVITKDKYDQLPILDKWLKSYHPEELFDIDGKLLSDIKSIIPKSEKCMGMSPYANGGLLLKEIKTPIWENYALDIKSPGSFEKQDMMELGKYIRDVFLLNKDNKNFRLFGPDEAMSNKMSHIFEVEKRMWNYKTLKNDEFLSPTGRVMDSYLSEHLCEGMLEGYLLTGRHGFFHTYEAFSRIIDSMVAQHAKWLKVCKELSFRKDISSLNIVLTSHVFQQDHNGYTHQEPGFLNHLSTKKDDIVNIYLPPDTNCLLATFDKCLKTKNKINAIVASKHLRPQYLNKAHAKVHVENGIGVFNFASNDLGKPDIILACCGETPTLEVLAATNLLRTTVKDIKIRVINVVELMRLKKGHPRGLSDIEFNTLFTKDVPVIFNFHGYPSLINQLIYNRDNKNILVKGYEEEGTITTTFDIRVQNKIDRFNIMKESLMLIPKYKSVSAPLLKWCDDMLSYHNSYIKQFGEDIPLVKEWKWNL